MANGEKSVKNNESALVEKANPDGNGVDDKWTRSEFHEWYQSLHRPRPRSKPPSMEHTPKLCEGRADGSDLIRLHWRVVMMVRANKASLG